MTSNPPPSGSGQGNQAERKDLGSLLDILLEKKLISPAQAQLAMADQEVTGLSLEDIVLARGWITEDGLAELVPKLKSTGAADDPIEFQPGSRSYDQNLKDYRKLMEKILGTAWD